MPIKETETDMGKEKREDERKEQTERLKLRKDTISEAINEKEKTATEQKGLCLSARRSGVHQPIILEAGKVITASEEFIIDR